MTDKWLHAGICLTSLAFVLTVSYLFALAGEPQSNWFWCEILQVCPIK